MMDTKLNVPLEVRELAVTGIDNVETALGLLFDAVTASNPPTSAASLALIRRVAAVKMDYARKVAHATDIEEATALQFEYCRAQVEITTDLIRIISDRRED
ncbi:MAG: hypothetical protein EKK35_23615 [Bradyrhizobiaceae bacterium]|nr:MAG: hypothetical protein EKK35_23615 [Bradyrhizobiaceae bacterium]